MPTEFKPGVLPADYAERTKYLYRMQELLRLEHNDKGQQYKDGKITLEQWDNYRNLQFTPKSDLIINEILKCRQSFKKDNTVNASVNDFQG